MTWSARLRIASTSPRAAKNSNVPTRIWLKATRVRTAPGSSVSRRTVSPLSTAASDRVVGMLSAAIAQLRHERPELVTGIGHGERLALVRHAVARKHLDALWRRKGCGIEPK